MLCRQRGAFSEAAAHLRRALDLRPASPQFQFDLAYTLGGAESARASGIDVRVWRFEGGAWQLLADVTAAVK